tara:strand:- start:316 stop:516 length:201 start_codon:yes stop_codon:yes gene_type:complete
MPMEVYDKSASFKNMAKKDLAHAPLIPTQKYITFAIEINVTALALKYFFSSTRVSFNDVYNIFSSW